MLTTKQLIGKRIKELRKLRKLSQEELAEMVGIAPRHLSSIETGRNFPSFVTLDKIMISLKIELIDIVDCPYKTYDINELREKIKEMIGEADELKLRLLLKIVRDIVR